MADNSGSGANPDYVYDFSAFQQNSASAGEGGMSFMGGGFGGGAGGQGGGMGGFGGGQGGAAAGQGGMGGGFGGSQGGAAAGQGGGQAGGGQGGDLASMLGQSPFGRLLDLPGVTPESLFANVNPNDYGGGNPFGALGMSAGGGADAPYGGNPFANLGRNQGSSFGEGGSAFPASFGGSNA